ncbi:MAG: stage II sporulation protein M [Oscillospiraceae bacterium]|nr:stage II sporulation protein M [Oscillospiraceae bacterium]
MKRIIRTSALKNGLFSHNRFFISVFWLIGVGILLGSAAAGMFSDYENSFVNGVWQAYFLKRETGSIFSCFVGTISSSFLTLALSYLLGLCAIGTPFLYLTLVFDSVGKGLVFGFLYLQYGFLGILKSVVFLLPQNVLICLLFVYAINFSVKMSKQMYCLLSDDKITVDYHLNFKKYNQKYLFFGFCLVLISAFDALMSRFTYLITK